MARRELGIFGSLVALIGVGALPVAAQSFRVQCPASTITHPATLHDNNTEPAYTGPTTLSAPSATTYQAPTGNVNGAIKCQQISGGDGYATMGDGTQTYMFSFGPLSGLADIAAGRPGTQSPAVFNTPHPGCTGSACAAPLLPGDPATTGASFTYNGAVGQTFDVPFIANVFAVQEGPVTATVNGVTTTKNYTPKTVTVILNEPATLSVGDSVILTGVNASAGATSGYDGTWTVTAINIPNPYFTPNFAFQFLSTVSGLPAGNLFTTATVTTPPRMDGHVDPRPIMDIGVMNGNIPAPLMAIEEDDEFFLTLTNVGMIMRPDLFEQHTVHFHGYPNASSFYDGVPDASVAINIGGSFTYYYLAPDAGTYFWHCHITPPEHLQMGMVGQLYVRPRQNRVAAGTSLYTAILQQQKDPRTASNCVADILCVAPVPPSNTVNRAASGNYAYNDGDGSTYYDVEVPLQMHGFDPNFHFVGMTFNPEGFTDMKDKYFLLNGRSYPDTVTSGPLQTQSADGVNHFSQPLSAIISITAGQRALLRISDLDVTEYQTLASLGVPMQVIGYNAKLLRDQAGNNLYYNTNSITLGGGESLDAILDTCLVRSTPADPSSACTTAIPAGTYYLYTPNLDHLSNDAENFGGLMTEVHVN